jgi:hypothetical protein
MLINEYRVSFADKAEKIVLRTDMTQVAKDFEKPDNMITQVVRTRVDLDAAIPLPQVMVEFHVIVTPEGAVTADCVALPDGYVVPSGTEILFQAVPGPGYTFTGWLMGNEIVSTDAKATLAIVPNMGLDRCLIDARFEAV